MSWHTRSLLPPLKHLLANEALTLSKTFRGHLWNQLANSSEMAIRYASHFQYIPGSLLTRLALFEEQRDIAATLPGLVATFHKLFKDEALSRKMHVTTQVLHFISYQRFFHEKDFSDKWFETGRHWPVPQLQNRTKD